MSPELRDLAVGLLDRHRIMTLATNRLDGWPQATVVGYVNEGLTLYCFISRLGQKYANIVRDARVSAAIASDYSQPLDIRGLSLAGKAAPVTDASELDRAYEVFLKRHPEYAAWPRPSPAISPMLRLTPIIMSVLDYSKGFGHSDLVKIEAGDLKPSSSQRHHWLGHSS
jgi:nitroimidazol reductase NimA-like FMN-containing flavoprotein (pyridoxamine 5'-phosphate oxidase superfamily)